MYKKSDNIQEDIKKNKPHILGPIIVTFIASVLIILITVFKGISNMFTLTEYLLMIGILILLAVASWFGSYFVRKQKTQMLEDYDEETKLMVDFVEKKTDFYSRDESDEIKVLASFEKTDEELNKVHYKAEDSSFGDLDKSLGYICIGLGFTSIEVDYHNMTAKSIKGLLPRSVSLPKHLKPINPTKGIITFNVSGIDFRNKTCLHINIHDDTYFDGKKNLVCIGETKIYSIDDVIEFCEGVSLVLRDGKIISLWLDLNKITNE